MKNKKLILNFTSYTIKGISDLTMWGGGNACIPMKAFNVQETSDKTLLANINDNGFGVESINGAICDIYENYEGTLKFKETKTVGNVSMNTNEFYLDYIE